MDCQAGAVAQQLAERKDRLEQAPHAHLLCLLIVAISFTFTSTYFKIQKLYTKTL